MHKSALTVVASVIAFGVIATAPIVLAAQNKMTQVELEKVFMVDKDHPANATIIFDRNQTLRDLSGKEKTPRIQVSLFYSDRLAMPLADKLNLMTYFDEHRNCGDECKIRDKNFPNKKAVYVTENFQITDKSNNNFGYFSYVENKAKDKKKLIFITPNHAGVTIDSSQLIPIIEILKKAIVTGDRILFDSEKEALSKMNYRLVVVDVANFIKN